MYKCLECGHIFEDGEQATWQESRGEFWGQPVSETMNGCPKCHGDYEETKPCVECGSEQLEEDLYGGMCKECLEPYVNDFDTCLRLGYVDRESVEINSFILSLLKVSEIEDILIRELKESNKIMPSDCSAFAYDDLEWFAENLRKEVLNNAKKNI